MFEDLWNVLELLEGREVYKRWLVTCVLTHSIESTLANNDLVEECSNAPYVNFVIIVLLKQREGERERERGREKGREREGERERERERKREGVTED